MATIKDVLEHTKLLDDVRDSIKYKWLGELDKRVYRYPDDAHTELKYTLYLYEKYIVAMHDFFSGDMDAYVESARKFRLAYERECR